MAGGEGNKVAKKKEKEIHLKPIIIRFATLFIMAFILVQATSFLLGDMLFYDRLDRNRAVALGYSFRATPFKSKDVISNITGKSILVLDVTFQEEKLCIYSENFTSNEIENVGVLEREGEIYLVIGVSDVKDGKKYVIDGKFVDFHEYGTTEEVPVLLVESYHESNPLDELILAKPIWISHLAIGISVLTSACIMVILVSIIAIFIEIAELSDEFEIIPRI